MWKLTAVNDFVIKFANVNGSGSASANGMFAKAIFRMGIPVAPKNIFPSNIQGLPTWYEVRVNGKGYLGRRGGVDIAVAMNAQTLAKDVAEIEPGGYLIYDSTKPLPPELLRSDIHILPIPITELCRSEFTNAKQRQMFKNIVYVGALSALLDIEFEVLEQLVGEQFPGKEHLIGSNMKALAIGRDYMLAQFECPLSIKLQRATVVGDKVLVDGNTAAGLGCVYAGATVVGWYPITPSTSVVDAFTKYANQLRVDSATGRKKFAIAQAEDELAAIGMVIGAMWNGARAFTATSGPGISLMSEFLGLAYFAEIPTVLFNVQRAGPSTGMPTRTQQADVFACAYASHGDTKQLLLFPANPTECFEMGAAAFDIAERMQTPVIIMSDLDLGMNDHVTPAFQWDDAAQWDRGKVLNAQELDEVERFGRYRDIDGDGIPYRTLPGTHPEKGQFFTRGTSRDPDAIYTEESHHYVDNMDRLVEKFNTATQYIPAPEVELSVTGSSIGVVFYGTTADAMYEARDLLAEQGQHVDLLRIKSFPFHRQVADFCEQRDLIFVVEQNRDGQMRKLLINECELHPKTLLSVLNYDGMPITATTIQSEISDQLDARQGKLQVVGAK